jgi:hypothetical protein
VHGLGFSFQRSGRWGKLKVVKNNQRQRAQVEKRQAVNAEGNGCLESRVGKKS